MKSSIILAAGAALLLSACAPMHYPGLSSPPATAYPQAQPANPYGQYTTVPTAQPHVSAPAYAQPTAYTTPHGYLQPAATTYTDPLTGQAMAFQHPAQPAYTEQVAPAPGYSTVGQTQPGMGAVAGVPAGPTSPQPTAVGGGANYALQLTNGTTGRLFVEVFDDSDNVFPVGYMFAGANLSTPPSEARPISGRLTVVIRDPDKPNAPELRRYKVDPPANYAGRTIGITILPGGRYRASLDGEVYYTSPEPTRPSAPATPAPAASAAPASAAAPAPAPAPTPAPAPAPAADPMPIPTLVPVEANPAADAKRPSNIL